VLSLYFSGRCKTHCFSIHVVPVVSVFNLRVGQLLEWGTNYHELCPMVIVALVPNCPDPIFTSFAEFRSDSEELRARASHGVLFRKEFGPLKFSEVILMRSRGFFKRTRFVVSVVQEPRSPFVYLRVPFKFEKSTKNFLKISSKGLRWRAWGNL
jgi:hypothetical protein